MALKEVQFTHKLPETLDAMAKHGLLLTTVGADGRPNVMAIGWGLAGIIWSRPMFVALVRPSRFTFCNLEATGEFVVNVPTDEMHDTCMYCGTVSGRDVDKFAERRLATIKAKTVKVPLIKQCIRHYECRVVHRNDVADGALSPEVRAEAYPKGDLHRLYYGQVLRVTERA